MPRTMNDPHVVTLTFRIEHDSSVAYRADAPPIQHEENAFRVALEDGTVRFELKEHHATEEEALERVLPYVRSWELDACLRGRPGDFRLHFQQAEVIDRDPSPSPPGAVTASGTPIVAVGTPGSATGLVTKPSYPPPPSGVPLKADDPDVAKMYHRLSGYSEGHELLPSMAYFCLTMIERPFPGRTATGAHYHIDVSVLNEIGKLSSTRGGAGWARKAKAADTELSQQESRFLEAAVKKLIHRAAEVAQDPGGAFPTITLASLTRSF